MIKVKPEWHINKFESEYQFQAAAVLLLSQNFPQLRDKFWHTNNEFYIPKREGESEKDYEKRKMMEGNRNKGQGMKSGIPDILVVYRGVLHKCELKQPKGSLSPTQKILKDLWDKDCRLTPITVCYNLYEVYVWAKNIIKSSIKAVEYDYEVLFAKYLNPDCWSFTEEELMRIESLKLTHF